MKFRQVVARRAVPAVCAALFAVPGLAVAASATTSTEYSVFPLAEHPASTVLMVPDDGIVTLYLSRSGDVPAQPETLEIGLTTFVDARGRSVPVALLVHDEKPQATVKSSEPRMVKVDQAQLPLRLHVGEIPSPRSVSGHLLLSRSGARIKTYAITLNGRSADRGAKLKLDRPEVTIDAVQPLFGFLGGQTARFIVAVRDESGDWPLTGLYARLEEAKSLENNFDPQRDLQVSVNGAPVKNFWVLDEAARGAANRAVAPAGQAIVEGTLPDLPPGQYTAKIRFLAANSQDDAGQVLNLKVNVRKSLGFAVGLLLLGIALSLVITVVLKSRAAMLRLRLRIFQLRPSWLGDEPSSRVVTWVRSIFKQAEDLRQHFTVAATDILEERVTQAAQHLPYLEQLSRLRGRIDGSGWDRMVRRRAHKVLQRINNRLIPGRLDEQTAAIIQREIDRLNAWFPDAWADPYWADLKKDIDTLLSAVDETSFEGASGKVVEDLVKEVEGPKPSGTKGLVEHEARYAALKLLWERRGDDAQVEALVKLWERRQRIDDLFLYADKAAWLKLKEKKDEVRFIKPKHTSLEPFEPFQPLLFEVAPDRPELGDNYLFKHNLRFQWKIVLTDRSRLQGMKAAIGPALGLQQQDPIPPLTPETQEPLVVQYAPRKCTMTASVRLQYRDDSLDVAAGPEGLPPFCVTIAGSTFKRLMRSVETTEMVSLGMAVVVGTASGLLTQYFGNSTWGSARDIIGLFLWGVGADQASKSFVDVVNRFPGRWQDGTKPATVDTTKHAATPAAEPSSTTTGAPTGAPVTAPGVGGMAPKQAPPV